MNLHLDNNYIDTIEMQSIIEQLNNLSIEILSSGVYIYNNNTIEKANELEDYSMYLFEMSEQIKNISGLFERFADECNNSALDIRKKIILREKYKEDPVCDIKVNRELYKDIKWGDMAEDDDNKEILLNEINNAIESDVLIDSNPVYYKKLTDIYKKPLGCEWRAPIVSKINDIPPALYWFRGDAENSEGVYIKLSEGFCLQVPFPNVIDSTQNTDRTGSIKCKYKNITDCFEVRNNLSKKYNTNVRECNFAHSGDRYNKMGTNFRSPSIPRFGNHNHLKQDLVDTPVDDIKTVLMYALSDILLSSVWFQQQNLNDVILTDIDIC